MKLATLKNIYRNLNATVFSNLLTEPVILAKRWRNAHGQHVVPTNGRNRMEFNPAGIVGLSHARAVIYHEMVHQYVEEILDIQEDDHHGPIFWAWYTHLIKEPIELGEVL